MYRKAAVAGLFYPGTGAELRSSLEAYFVSAIPALESCPKMLIVPHAGYQYSGAIAAAAYAQLRPFADFYRHVVILGPAHRLAFQGIASSTASAFMTPMGEVALCPADGLPGCQPVDAAHEMEHCLEVQLPFLQFLLNDFDCTPLLVGQCSDAVLREALLQVWGHDDTLIIISTDLSHFHTDAEARELDADAIIRINALWPSLDREQACGHAPLNAALAVAREKNLQILELARGNSGATSGDLNRVVGYASFALFEPGRDRNETHLN